MPPAPLRLKYLAILPTAKGTPHNVPTHVSSLGDSSRIGSRPRSFGNETEISKPRYQKYERVKGQRKKKAIAALHQAPIASFFQVPGPPVSTPSAPVATSSAVVVDIHGSGNPAVDPGPPASLPEMDVGQYPVTSVRVSELARESSESLTANKAPSTQPEQ